MRFIVIALLIAIVVSLASALPGQRPLGRGWPEAQSQYTTTNKPSQTTSTKCQYHATASNAK